jgi:hypothetical protein
MSKLRDLIGIASLLKGTSRESVSRVEELECSVDPEPPKIRSTEQQIPCLDEQNTLPEQ